MKGSDPTSPNAGRSVSQAQKRAGEPRGGHSATTTHPDVHAAAPASTLPALGEGAKAIRGATMRLRDAGIESPRLEARLLLAHALHATQEDVIAGRAMIDAAAAARFDTLVQRRCTHEPLAYITGAREFWSLPFAVGPGVLIPRPDSETLVEEALRRFADPDAPLRVLDLGTGSGCLLLAFLSERPHASGLGIDISPEALAWADKNAHALFLQGRCEFRSGDFADARGAFDVVFANPPYIPARELSTLALDVKGFEPQIALDGGPDGLQYYRRIAAVVPRLLARGGLAFIELGAGGAKSASEIFIAAGLAVEDIVKDFALIPRCLVAASQTARGRQVKRKKQMEKERGSG